jgi:hypothetical protein
MMAWCSGYSTRKFIERYKCSEGRNTDTTVLYDCSLLRYIRCSTWNHTQKESTVFYFQTVQLWHFFGWWLLPLYHDQSWILKNSPILTKVNPCIFQKTLLQILKIDIWCMTSPCKIIGPWKTNITEANQSKLCSSAPYWNYMKDTVVLSRTTLCAMWPR